jgi:hypothetical protein
LLRLNHFLKLSLFLFATFIPPVCCTDFTAFN